MDLATLLPPDAVLPHLAARDKKQVLKTLSAQAAKITPLLERDIYSILLEREKIGCTGMGHGVAIPHGRFDDLKTVHAVFARLDRAVEFGAADGQPVDLVLLLMTPASANTEHLKALAVVSRLLRDKPLCKRIRATHDAELMHKLLTSERDED